MLRGGCLDGVLRHRASDHTGAAGVARVSLPLFRANRKAASGAKSAEAGPRWQHGPRLGDPAARHSEAGEQAVQRQADSQGWLAAGSCPVAGLGQPTAPVHCSGSLHRFTAPVHCAGPSRYRFDSRSLHRARRCSGLERAASQRLHHMVHKAGDACRQCRISIVDGIDGLADVQRLLAKQLHQISLLAVCARHEV